MKTLLIVLLLLPFTAISQDTAPFKKCNQIQIATTLTGKEALKKVASELIKSGYTISNSDTELLTLQTNKKKYKGEFVASINVFIQESGEGSIIYLSGEYGAETLGFLSIDYRGSKKSPAYLAWSQLQALANKIEGVKTYHKT